MLTTLALCALAGLTGCTRAGGPSTYSPVHASRYTGTRLEPASATERKVLDLLDQLVPGEPAPLGNVIVVAQAPYSAASGRACRHLELRRRGAAAQERLACKDGATWFFAPTVLAPAPRP